MRDPYTVALLIASVLMAQVAIVALFVGRDRMWDEWRDYCAEHSIDPESGCES